MDIDDSLNFREILWTGGDDEGTFLGELAALKARWHIPTGVLPFARKYGGSVAFLDLRPQTCGAILALLTDLQPEIASVGLVPELSDEALG